MDVQAEDQLAAGRVPQLREVVALVGDSGAGKPTLIKAIAGVAPAPCSKVRAAVAAPVFHRPHSSGRDV
jgi:ABC-type sugar transport system ATPase subunit